MVVIGCAFLSLLVAVTVQLKRERVHLTHSSRLQLILAERVRRRELEAAEHTAVRKMRCMNNWAQLTVFWDPSQGNGVAHSRWVFPYPESLSQR